MIKKKLAIVAGLVLVMGLLAGCRSGENGEVYVYCYGDYYDPEIIADFEYDTGIRVIQDTYDTAEEMYPVIKNQSADYDVVCTSDYMIEKMIDENMLLELDKSNIKNLKNMDEKYMKMSESFDPGNTYSVPHMVGVSGILYNKKMVGNKKIDSWADLWDPAFKDQLVMPDSVRDDFMIALRKLGYDQNTTNPAEIAAAKEELIKQKPLVYKYANDSARDLLADGSAAVGVVWNGEYMYTKELNKDVEFVVPKEGSEFFIDSWCIPNTSKNKKNAEKFINYMLKAKVAKRNFDYLYYTLPNQAGQDLIKSKYRNDPAIFPTDELVAQCSTLRTLSPEATKLYSDSWKEVKAN